jgi:hypothetical protein
MPMDRDEPVPWRVFNLSAILFSGVVASVIAWAITFTLSTTASLATQAAVARAQAELPSSMVRQGDARDQAIAALRESQAATKVLIDIVLRGMTPHAPAPPASEKP